MVGALLTFMLMLATTAASATTSPGPTETPALFSCGAPGAIESAAAQP